MKDKRVTRNVFTNILEKCTERHILRRKKKDEINEEMMKTSIFLSLLLLFFKPRRFNIVAQVYTELHCFMAAQ